MSTKVLQFHFFIMHFFKKMISFCQCFCFDHRISYIFTNVDANLWSMWILIGFSYSMLSSFIKILSNYLTNTLIDVKYCRDNKVEIKLCLIFASIVLSNHSILCYLAYAQLSYIFSLFFNGLQLF